MEGFTLDEVQEWADIIVLTNSKYLITWSGRNIYQRWDRGQGEDQYFFADGWKTLTVDEDHARAIACSYALGTLGK